MPSALPSLNFVLFDLSTLDTAAAVSFLSELAHRQQSRALDLGKTCHWLVSAPKAQDLLSQEGAGADWLRRRLSEGDRLLCPPPLGLDWTGLFPFEAERELQAVEALTGRETWLFLPHLDGEPPWLGGLSRAVFQAADEGLRLHRASQSVEIPWGRAGVWWLAPGQALVAALPPLPWGDLTTLDAKTPARNRLRPNADEMVLTPKKKLAVSRTAQLRKAAAPTAMQQTVLHKSQEFPGLGDKEAVDFEEALGGIRKRALVANMQGLTDFQEGGIKVRFDGGRLVRIEDTQKKALLCTGAESFVSWNGRKHAFVTNSAFSFEGDFSWGLRQSLVLHHEDLAQPGRLILDFFFVEESREFFVAATVRWPQWKSPTTIQEWSVLKLEFSARPTPNSLVTRTLWPDGSAQDQLHRKNNRRGVLCGTDFVFGLGNSALALGFPQNQAPRPHYLPWTLERRWTGTRLVLNPEGGQAARPSTEFDGLEEHFSFYWSRAEGAKLPFTVTRKLASELIPPYVIET